MCTIAYIPRNAPNFSLVFVRDESPERQQANFPKIISKDTFSIVYPEDEASGGSWISYNNKGSIHCLMNGAFKKYHASKSIKMSRGLVLIDASRYNHLYDFSKSYDFKEIAPFTLISITNFRSPHFAEFRWPGGKAEGIFREYTSIGANLWSSATIYDPKVQKMKEKEFYCWFKSKKGIGDQHIYSYIRDPKSRFLLNKEEVLSVSITCIHVMLTNNQIIINYQDLRKGNIKEIVLKG